MATCYTPLRQPTPRLNKHNTYTGKRSARANSARCAGGTKPGTWHSRSGPTGTRHTRPETRHPSPWTRHAKSRTRHDAWETREAWNKTLEVCTDGNTTHEAWNMTHARGARREAWNMTNVRANSVRSAGGTKPGTLHSRSAPRGTRHTRPRTRYPSPGKWHARPKHDRTRKARQDARNTRGLQHDTRGLHRRAHDTRGLEHDTRSPEHNTTRERHERPAPWHSRSAPTGTRHTRPGHGPIEFVSLEFVCTGALFHLHRHSSAISSPLRPVREDELAQVATRGLRARDCRGRSRARWSHPVASSGAGEAEWPPHKVPISRKLKNHSPPLQRRRTTGTREELELDEWYSQREAGRRRNPRPRWPRGPPWQQTAPAPPSSAGSHNGNSLLKSSNSVCLFILSWSPPRQNWLQIAEAISENDKIKWKSLSKNYSARWSRVAEDEPPMLPGARVLNVPFMFTGYLQDQDARLEDINKSSNCINPAPRTEDAARSGTPHDVPHSTPPIPGGCHPYLRNVSAFSVNFHLNRWRYSHVTSFLANHAAMFLGPWACGSECCSSNSNAPDTSQKGLIGIQSHHPREKNVEKRSWKTGRGRFH